MTTTPTQQPKALQLADRLKERIRQLNNSWNAKWNRSTEEFDLCAKSEDELRRLTAENEALKAAVSNAVAAEREACEERVVSLFEVLEKPYLPDITRAIHARDKA